MREALDGRHPHSCPRTNPLLTDRCRNNLQVGIEDADAFSASKENLHFPRQQASFLSSFAGSKHLSYGNFQMSLACVALNNLNF